MVEGPTVIAAMDSTSPRIAFVLATLICLVAAVYFVWEHFNPEDESSPDSSRSESSAPASPSATPQAKGQR